MFLVAALLCFATAAGAAAIAWHIAESLPSDDRRRIRRAVQVVVGWVQNRRVGPETADDRNTPDGAR